MQPNSYFQVFFETTDPDQQELLVAILAAEEWEGFEQRDDGLVAFIPVAQADEQRLQEIAAQWGLHYSSTVVEQRNWNKEWESGFEPVQVDDFAVVRASFHEPVQGVLHDLIITPRMSFGTGHHATTFLMIRHLRNTSLEGKRVFDFGTGTGVLAILAEKCGAAEVLAIDYDEWSIANAADNIAENHCSRIVLEQSDHAGGKGSFDVILANINRNVILDNMNELANSLLPGGELLLSGLLTDDEPAVRTAAESCLLDFAGRDERDKWLFLRFLRKR